jgi:O-antigen biosynthesis protein WbqP
MMAKKVDRLIPALNKNVNINIMKRSFDLCIALLILIVAVIPTIAISIVVKLTSKGPVLYWSDRVGKNNVLFKMPKFRTMKIGTPPIATHLMINPDRYVTLIGGFLRRTSLDELPQLYSILRGDMSIVGPRPALFNQDDLVSLRTQRNVHRLTPGLTGWAQVNGRDEIPIPVKVDYDAYYLEHQSFLFDLKIILITFLKVLRKEGITH